MRRFLMMLLLLVCLPACAFAAEGDPLLSVDDLLTLEESYEAFLRELEALAVERGLLSEEERSAWHDAQLGDFYQNGGYGSILSNYMPGVLNLVRGEETVLTLTAQLSGGQKKRVALAAVVSMNPDILVLDEPTNGLDEESCDIVVNFLLAYVAAGKTVLMSTHHQDLVRRLGARAIYIDRYHHVVEAPVPSYGTENGAAE